MQKNMKEILKVDDLVKSYQQKPVVNELSFTLREGEVAGLLGPNGAGKTTAFYIIIGLIKQESGKIHFKQKDISHLPMHERAIMGLGYLTQEPSIFRNLTVEENLLCILETLDLTPKQQELRMKDLLQELHLEHLKKKKAITLSGGERRRLEITRTLIKEPSLLLLDEPFANIDPLAVQDVKNLIRLLKQKNITILITDHNAREIFSVVDRSYIMQDGKIILSGSVKELLNNKEARRCYLGENFSI
jgi:lipopolysaccharide export system ATP-binding protein